MPNQRFEVVAHNFSAPLKRGVSSQVRSQPANREA